MIIIITINTNYGIIYPIQMEMEWFNVQGSNCRR